MASILAFLDAAGSMVLWTALTLFVVVNGAFVALVMLRRDRTLVDRWTKRLVVADAALLLAAGGAPVATWAVRTTVKAVAVVLPSGDTFVAPSADVATPATGQR